MTNVIDDMDEIFAALQDNECTMGSTPLFPCSWTCEEAMFFEEDLEKFFAELVEPTVTNQVLQNSAMFLEETMFFEEDLEKFFAEPAEPTITNQVLQNSAMFLEETMFFEEDLEKFFAEPAEPTITNQVLQNSAMEIQEHNNGVVYHDELPTETEEVKLQCYLDHSLISWSQDFECQTSQISSGSKPMQKEVANKKGSPWTEEEHKKFLIGLEKYGKGNWKSISRFAVVTRTPTQVASHAQKFYLRHNAVKKGKKKSSIFDITTPKKEDSVTQLIDQSWNSPPPSGGPIQQTLPLQPLGQ